MTIIREKWPLEAQRIIAATMRKDKRRASLILSYDVRENSGWPDAVLASLFIWETTSEGHEYWKRVATGGGDKVEGFGYKHPCSKRCTAQREAGLAYMRYLGTPRWPYASAKQVERQPKADGQEDTAMKYSDLKAGDLVQTDANFTCMLRYKHVVQEDCVAYSSTAPMAITFWLDSEW